YAKHLRLGKSRENRDTKVPLTLRNQNIVTALLRARSCLSKARRALCRKQMKPTMKRNLLAVAAAGAIALGGFVVVQAQPGPGSAGHWHGHAFGLSSITEKLDLTADQEAKVQPILD